MKKRENKKLVISNKRGIKLLRMKEKDCGSIMYIIFIFFQKSKTKMPSIGANNSTLIEAELKQLEKIKFKQVTHKIFLEKINITNYFTLNANGRNQKAKSI